MRKSSSGCDGLVCFLGCLSLVPGFRKRLVSRAAFFPPSPPGYFIAETDTSKIVFLDLPRPCAGAPFRTQLQPLPSSDISSYGTISIKHLEIPTREGLPVHAFYFTRPDAVHTIIFSHGNSTFVRMLRVNLLAYDFSGYGASPGVPSEQRLYTNISAVFEYLTGNEHRLSPSQLILYGQSVGSAPTIDLASRVEGIAGVIVHSGMKSGLTVLRSNYDTVHWFDAFKNVEKIQTLRCPVFIIHGTEDEEVNIEHGMALYEAAPRARCWWAQGAGHNNIEVLYRKEYFVKLTDFLASINPSHRAVLSARYASSNAETTDDSATTDAAVLSTDFLCNDSQEQQQGQLLQS